MYLSEDSITFTDELVAAPLDAVASPGSVEELLGGVKLLLSETLVQRVGACFQFDISSEDGQCHNYYVDLSKGDKSVFAPNMPHLPEHFHSVKSTNQMQVTFD